MPNHPNRSGDLKRVKEAVGRGRMLGWQLTRLHINMPVGEPPTARVGWKIPRSDLIDTAHLHDTPVGISRSEWHAPDDDVVQLGSWSDDVSRELCRWLGVSGFNRLANDQYVAWVHDLPALSGGKKY